MFRCLTEVLLCAECPCTRCCSVYVLSGRVAADLAAMREGSLRQFANEGGVCVRREQYFDRCRSDASSA